MAGARRTPDPAGTARIPAAWEDQHIEGSARPRIRAAEDLLGDPEAILVKMSARNQFPATVRSVVDGAVMAEVTVEVDGGQTLVAAITAESARRLGLAPGTRVVAIIKATEVILATED